jgi:hypothetical protein
MSYHKENRLRNVARLGKLRIYRTFTLLALFITLILLSYNINAAPVGPSVTEISNSTATLRSSTMINTTGGSVTTMTLNVTAQNYKWKAFVGNVTGSLMLADASGYSVYDWSLSTVVGEVYATRTPTLVSWSNIKCANKTHIGYEEITLSHTNNPDDNITATFNVKNHTSFYVGTKEFETNECYSLHTNVNNQSQSTSFEEMLLYDGTNSTNGDIIYTTKLEQATLGYNNNPFDFQMIVPENGEASWDGATAYYFYVELG